MIKRSNIAPMTEDEKRAIAAAPDAEAAARGLGLHGLNFAITREQNDAIKALNAQLSPAHQRITVEMLEKITRQTYTNWA